ncbi:DUF4286 family protein [Prosthecodimorpha staleyi]|uniref:Uncharacterized protein n=1 Tax=Prosthecodimorpha staleyi TaxID=2840188 RepID=A0A947D3B1_9HYPH|nr:DUF4286 family protein [Prosthecodimorpha staleyi]MBT9289990.1 hypothetical protein [Prosthecodimorpha staleyi]
MPNKGLLLVMMQASPDFEDEFNAWYDTQHVPERLAVPGITTAHRFEAESGWPKYLALYDLDSVAVLDSSAYARVSGANNSPWTRRVLSRVDARRIVCEQIGPGSEAVTAAPRVAVLRFAGVPETARPEVAAGLARSFGGMPGIRQVRLFADTEAAGTLYAVIAGTLPPLAIFDPAAFGPWQNAIDLTNGYAARAPRG